MNSRQISILSMHRRVLNFLKKYLSVLMPLPEFNPLLLEYENQLIQLNALGDQQGTDIRGLRTQKEVTKQSTGLKALDMSRRIEAYAKIKGDVVLVQKAHYSDTELLKSSDYEFISSCTIISNMAEELGGELVGYNATPELRADLLKSIADYKAVVDAPKEGYTGKKQATNQITDLFSIQLGVLDKLDALVELVRYTQPALYAEYQDTRKVPYRSGSLTVKCDVTDAATHARLAGANVVFSLDGETVLEKTTSAAGGFTVKSMDDGTYTVSVSRLGYVTQTLTVNVLNVEMTSIKVALVANP
jgi:hypothetical protein